LKLEAEKEIKLFGGKKIIVKIQGKNNIFPQESFINRE